MPTGVVNATDLPKIVGQGAGTRPTRQIPFRTIGGDSGSPATPAAATAQTTAALPVIAPGPQRTPALALRDNIDGLTPPDMALGADATHVVEMVNVEGRIWTGANAGFAFQLSSFFASGQDFITDPWAFFDQESGRWFAGISDLNLGGQRLAVSRTGDPTGFWSLYAIQYPGLVGGSGQGIGSCPDQAKAGIDNNVVAVSFNEYASDCTHFLGNAIEVLNKADLVAGVAVHFAYTDLMRKFISLVPAQAVSGGQTTEYFAGHDLNNTSAALHRMTSVGTPGVDTVTFSVLDDLPLAHTYPRPPNAKQPGTAIKLPSDDQRVNNVVWKRDVGLVMTWAEACIPADDTAPRACARVVATNDGVGGPAVTMDTDLAKKGQYYVFPAVTVNTANVVVVAFGVSSSTIFPQLDAAAAQIGGVFTPPIVLAKGAAPNTTGRYGDYFAVALDPSGTANQNVWAAGEIGGPLNNDWQTAIREINVSP